MNLNVTATLVFVAFFALVTVLGFAAARWKSGDLRDLHEWGLGGRRFGTWITWFLLGGDLYTAYTVIAVPALVYSVGAYGFFAVPYTIVVYPFIFLTMPRLWSVAHRRGYVTAADFARDRYGNRWLELAVAFTGILATMPYIALQLVGMEKVIQGLGFGGGTLASHLPLTIAFLILAVYTYSSGLRAPAMIAFVKDIMIYIFVVAAIILIPMKLGGYGAIFAAAQKSFADQGGATGLTLRPEQIMPYITTALGSGMALFMYPHSLTGVLSASSSRSIKRNAMLLPAYSLVLGFIAILGLMARAADIKLDKAHAQDVVPQLVLKMFSDANWFVGFVFAAIAIGALVPAAVMSIGAANTFTRNIWRPFVEPDMSGEREAMLAKLVSLIVKVGALAVILFIQTQFAIDFQLLGGVWMIQIFPVVIFGLYTRWFRGWALLLGWATGMIIGTWLAWNGAAWVPTHTVFGLFAAYNAVIAVAANVIVSVVVSAVLPNTAPDRIKPADYEAGASIHA